MNSWLFIPVFLVLLALRVPIAFSLGLSSVVYFLMSGMPLTTIPQLMITPFDSFPILAVPLFMLAGELMNIGGVSRRLFAFAKALVGHIPGSLGHVSIVASMIFAGMSGSAVAEAAGLGTVEIKQMVDDGFEPDFAAAIAGSAATIGPIIPPSIPFVIYGAIVGVSVGALFAGGALPGVLMGLAMMPLVYVIAKRRSYKVYKRATWKELAVAFKSAFLPLLTPVILLTGILSGVVTPTEAAVLAVVYAIILGMFIYREYSLAELFRIVVQVGQGAGTVVFILTTATVFGWILAYEGVPGIITKVLFGVTHNKFLILLILNIWFLILGCFMDTITVLLVMVPMVVPAVKEARIDLVHFGVTVTLNLMIGMLTPPVGMCAYVVADIAKISFERVVRAMVPFMIILTGVLLLITYFPETVTWLPSLFGYVPTR
jgi:tripartite ATP-independent transporter DctM subunit